MFREPQEWLRLCEAVVRESSDAIVITEAGPLELPGPRILFVNRAFTRITGYQPEEVLGKTPRILQGEKTQPEQIQRIRAALSKGEPVHAELINYRKDGSEFWTDIYIFPICDGDGRVRYWAAAKRDITRRKSVEEALRRSEETNRALLDALPDMMLRLSADGVYLDCKVSKEFEPLLPPQEFIGRPIIEVTPPVVAVRAMDALRRAMETGETQVFEYHLDSGEDARHFEARVVKCGKGEAVALVRDVTARKRLERQFREAQKMEAVGRLAGGLAHDFNNYLMVIGGYAQLLLDSLAEGSTLRGEVEEIVRAADRASALTSRLLSFTRRHSTPPAVISVNAIVAGMDKLLRRVTAENISLHLRLGPDAGNIRVDAAQLEQVLMNLVLNARDAMPEGGRLTIETGAVEVGEEYARTHVGASPGRYVMLSVADTGHGMDEETKSHVFEPFYTTKRPGKGTGLGLSIVYATVTQLGGHIDLVSEPGKGTTVRILLPAAPAPPEEQALEGAVRRPLPGTETVLLVEDEVGVRRLLKEVLNRSGYTVLEARDADEALRKAEAHPGPIGLLLTDVVMPRLTGADLARRVREQRAGMKVLYVSGYADDAALPRDRLQPGEAFLQKPFTPDRLLAKLRELLDT